MKSQLKNIGILVNDYRINYRVKDIIKFLLNNRDISNLYVFNLGIELKNKNKFSKFVSTYFKKGFYAFVSRIFFVFIIQFEKIFLLSENKNHLNTINIKDFFKEAIHLNQKNNNKFGLLLSKKNLEILQKKKLYLIINFSSQYLKGEILNSSKHGIISIHNGNPEYIRGGPSSFWEVCNSLKYSGYIIQKLGHGLDNGKILALKKLKTEKFFLRNQNKVYNKSYKHLKKVCEYIIIKNCLPRFIKVKASNKIYKSPSIKNVFRYIFSSYL